MQIIHGTSTGSSKDIHGISITDTDMRITRNGRRPFCDQGRPHFGIEIKQVRIAQMSGPVMSAVQDHGVLVHHGSSPIPSPRSSTGRGDGTPLGQGKVKFVQVGSINIRIRYREINKLVMTTTKLEKAYTIYTIHRTQHIHTIHHTPYIHTPYSTFPKIKYPTSACSTTVLTCTIHHILQRYRANADALLPHANASATAPAPTRPRLLSMSYSKSQSPKNQRLAMCHQILHGHKKNFQRRRPHVDP